MRQTSGDGGSGHSNGNESSADVFNRLYSGTIRDFIRCRECGHARERRDKFMDLALVVADMRCASDDNVCLMMCAGLVCFLSRSGWVWLDVHCAWSD